MKQFYTHKVFSLSVLLVAFNFFPIYGQKTSEKDSLLETYSAMSLEELLKVKITGKTIRDIGLFLVVESENIHKDTAINYPFTVEIIDEHTIKARAIKNIIEATENTNGIIFGQNPGSPNQFTIRGFISNYNKLLMDGIYLGLASLNTRPSTASNVERIEIIKGASSIFTGSSSVGGTINIVTRKPKFQKYHTHKISVGAGNFESSTFNIGFNGPIGNKWAYYLDLNRTSTENWMPKSKLRINNITAGIAWKPNSFIKNELMVYYSDDKLPGYWGTPLIPLKFAQEPLDIVKSNNGWVIDNSLSTINYNVEDYAISSQSVLLSDELQFRISKLFSGSIKLYGYTSDRAWQNSENYKFDTLSTNIIRDRFSVAHNAELWGANANIVYKQLFRNAENSLALHLDYRNSIFERNIGFLNGIIDTVDLRHPVSGKFGQVEERFDFFNEETLALVVSERVEFFNRIFINADFRIENNHVDRDRFNFDGSPRLNQSIHKNFVETSYKLGLVYKLPKNTAIYANYSYMHGSIAGDITTVALSKASNIEPSDINQLEAGVKMAAFDKKLQLAASVYRLNRFMTIQFENQTFSENHQQSQGAELSFDLGLYQHIKLGGSFAYNNSTFIKYYDANIAMDISGNKNLNAPEFISNMWVSANKILGLELETGLGYKFVSASMGNTDNTIELSSYNLLNAFAAYKLNDKHSFVFHIQNILNEKYIPWSEIGYENQFVLGTPRTFEIRMLFNF